MSSRDSATGRCIFRASDQCIFEFDPVLDARAVEHLPPLDAPAPCAPRGAAFRAGSYLVLKRLADILLLQLIREYVSSTCRETGWLRALSDPRIGGVLRSMHERIEQPWTVGELASQAGMSRSAFALRFKEVVGETPLDYLTRWRVYRAAVLLKEGDRKLSDIANAVGYDLDGSFNKTFKRIVGVTPGEYRRTGDRVTPEPKPFCAEQA